MRVILLALIFMLCSFGCLQDKCDEGIPKLLSSEKEATDFFNKADNRKLYFVKVENLPMTYDTETPDVEIQKIGVATIKITAKAVTPEEKAPAIKFINPPIVAKETKTVKPVTGKIPPVTITKKPKKD